jgi:N-acetylneuraminic acid mutarotase
MRPLLLVMAFTAAGCEAEDGAKTDSTPSEAEVWHEGPKLPQPITNNAVAAVTVDGVTSLFSFLGMDSTKVWSGVTSSAYRWDIGSDAWREIAPVPGPGRLASTAQVVGHRIYVIGGYTVAEDGSEKSLPDVAIYDPVQESWSRGADIPVPTDDAVAAVSSDGLIYLVSGWHDTNNVADVQIYDPERDRWSAATPIVGAPVFGHAGALVDGHLTYLGGAAVVDARPRFRVDSTAWAGTIDPAQPRAISWREVEARPGPPLYRSAGGVLGSLVLFVGGTDNPYNYDGIGYDGAPAQPLRQVVTYAPLRDSWGALEPLPVATMDHRNAAVSAGRVFMAGGMLVDQVVSDRVWWSNAAALLGTAREADMEGTQ